MSDSTSDDPGPAPTPSIDAPRRLSSVDDTRAYRNCVGEFATGVTVVTANDGDRPAGMTLNSFTSISLHPLLLLISLAHGARTLHAIQHSGRFAVSVLQRAQGDVAVAFSERGAPFPDQFTWHDRQGMHSVSGAAAVMWCEVEQIITAGDHDIVIGEVVDFDHQGGEPLIFYRGALGGLSADTHMPANHSIGLEEGAGW